MSATWEGWDPAPPAKPLELRPGDSLETTVEMKFGRALEDHEAAEGGGDPLLVVAGELRLMLTPLQLREDRRSVVCRVFVNYGKSPADPLVDNILEAREDPPHADPA